MTVRAWFTISALALVVLTAAFAFRFTRPIRAPEILTSAGSVRLHGIARASCWPQGGVKLRCSAGDDRPATDGPRVKPAGTMRVVVDFPVQPDGGSVELLRGRETLLDSPWTDRLPYDLEPGDYVLRADAKYSHNAHVRYDFPFRV